VARMFIQIISSDWCNSDFWQSASRNARMDLAIGPIDLDQATSFGLTNTRGCYFEWKRKLQFDDKHKILSNDGFINLASTPDA
jgi:hypothetical protein